MGRTGKQNPGCMRKRGDPAARRAEIPSLDRGQKWVPSSPPMHLSRCFCPSQEVFSCNCLMEAGLCELPHHCLASC